MYFSFSLPTLLTFLPFHPLFTRPCPILPCLTLNRPVICLLTFPILTQTYRTGSSCLFHLFFFTPPRPIIPFLTLNTPVIYLLPFPIPTQLYRAVPYLPLPFHLLFTLSCPVLPFPLLTLPLFYLLTFPILTLSYPTVPYLSLPYPFHSLSRVVAVQ